MSEPSRRGPGRGRPGGNAYRTKVVRYAGVMAFSLPTGRDNSASSFSGEEKGRGVRAGAWGTSEGRLAGGRVAVLVVVHVGHVAHVRVYLQPLADVRLPARFHEREEAVLARDDAH